MLISVFLMNINYHFKECKNIFNLTPNRYQYGLLPSVLYKSVMATPSSGRGRKWYSGSPQQPRHELLHWHSKGQFCFVISINTVLTILVLTFIWTFSSFPVIHMWLVPWFAAHQVQMLTNSTVIFFIFHLQMYGTKQ